MDAPNSIDTGRADDHDLLRRLQVVDAATGDVIPGVIVANATTGTVRRFEVKDGNFVRSGDSFVVVDENRDIRIEFVADVADVDTGDEG